MSRYLFYYGGAMTMSCLSPMAIVKLLVAIAGALLQVARWWLVARSRREQWREGDQGDELG